MAVTDPATEDAPAVVDGPAEAAASAEPKARRRSRRQVARPHAVFVRLSQEELEMVSAAAELVGMTRTGWVGDTAVRVARGQVQPLPADLGEVVRELVLARTQLSKYGTLLNQAVARLHATGEVDGALVAAAARCDAATASVRSATERLGRRR